MGSSGKERSVHSFSKQPPVNQVRPLDCFDSPHPSLKCYSDCLHTGCHSSITARFSRTPCSARSCNAWNYCELCGIVTSTRTTFFHAEGPQRFYLVGSLFDRPALQVAPSLARQSVATTIYGRDAIVPPIPAVQAFRAQANVVSVKSGATTPGSSSTPSSRTPQIPQVPKFGNSNSSIVARSVTARPIEVKKINSANRVPTMSNLVKEAARKSMTPTSSNESVQVFVDEKEVVASPTATTPSTIIEESPVSPLVIPKQPFAANHSARSSSVSGIQESTRGPTHRHSGSATLSALIEDSINRARDPQHMGVTSPTTRPELVKHDSGPFSDANEVKENIL